jgi:hypothetical protein
MANQKCLHCESRQICQEDSKSWFFIIVGFIATVSIRVVTVLMSIDPVYGKTAWYIGVLGFVIFFVYKYKVFKMRAHLIEQHDLLRKLAKGDPLPREDRDILSQLLCKIKSNKERVNFLFIFVVSAITLVVAMLFDFTPFFQ